MQQRYWKNTNKPTRVVQTGVKPKHGFYSILDDSMQGYNKMREDVIEQQYSECSKEHYKKYKYVKELY